MSETDQILKEVKVREGEIKKLSSYLSELESQLALIFAASPDLIVFIHKDGTIIKVSQAVWKILGYERDSLMGKSIFDLIHPEDAEKTQEIRKKLINDRHIYFDHSEYFSNRWRRADGSYATLVWRFSLYDENADHTIGFATDVTDLTLINPFNFGLIHKALRMTKDGVVITDMLHPDNTIIYANPAFCKNCGYESKELIGQNCRVLQSDDKDQAALFTIRESIKNGESCEVLLRNFKKDKTVFFNHVLISPIIEHSIITNYIGISRDLTQLINDGVYNWDRTAPRGFGKKL
jgi:PAS domain S-box-containing protein